MNTASVDAIAKLLDMTPRRVHQACKRGNHSEAEKPGAIGIVPCVVGYIKHIKGMLNGEARDLASGKTRLTRAQAEKLK